MKKVCTNITVRFRDIDAMGHVNNAVYFTYFEEGRKAFLREAIGIVRPVDYPFIMAKIACDFMKPITLEEEVKLCVWISEIGIKSFTFKYELCRSADESLVFGRGESVMVMYDYAAGKTVPIPDEFLERIKDYSE